MSCCSGPWHLPRHHYHGPGTRDFTQHPLDDDDVIAQEHDLAYKFATRASDIRRADRMAIRAFCHNIHNNWHSLLGLCGLCTKYSVESLTGILYPPRCRGK